MNKCSFLNQCNPFKMCTAAFDTPIFGTMCSPLNQNSLPFKIQDSFAEIFMRNIQFFRLEKIKPFCMSAVFHSKCQAPAFKKALLLNNMQRSSIQIVERFLSKLKRLTIIGHSKLKRFESSAVFLWTMFLLDGQYFRRCTVFPMNALCFEIPDCIYTSFRHAGNIFRKCKVLSECSLSCKNAQHCFKRMISLQSYTFICPYLCMIYT